MKASFFFMFLISSVVLLAQDLPCDSTIARIIQPITQADTITSSDTLYMSSLVSGTPVLVQSTVAICFENGFEVAASVSFEANIDGCLTDFSMENIFGGNIDLDNLENYANQPVPNYINEDNTDGNPITDMGATLGRVLFYDKNLSVNNTIACASCHLQEFGFSDTRVASVGVDGATGRHSMRLINSRFAEEERFFWDERAATLEDQATQPIQDHIEMGFSGNDGDPDLDSLIRKMNQLEYYPVLLTDAFGDAIITETRMQQAIAQFVRSIQSFDSKFDVGFDIVRSQGGNNQLGSNFPNYTDSENRGKALYLTNPNNQNGQRVSGGLGCNRCHGAPEFDIDDNSDNNGVIGVIGDANATDLTNTRSPSLRDLFDGNGNLNGPSMHDGSLTTITAIIDHYNVIEVNTNLDNRLRGGPGGGQNNGQRLNITAQERIDLEAFLKTLTGSDVYTNHKWSDPFVN